MADISSDSAVARTRRAAADDAVVDKALGGAAATLRASGRQDSSILDPLESACAVALAGLGLELHGAGSHAGDIASRLEYLGEQSGFGIREVRLDPGWHEQDCAHLVLISAADGHPLATRRAWGRNWVVDPAADVRTSRVPAARALVEPRAFELYATGGDAPLSTTTLMRIALRRLGPQPWLLGLLAVAIGALTIAIPASIAYAFAVILPQNDTSDLLPMLLLLLGITIASTLLTITAYRLVITMRSKARQAVGLALAHRLTRLPADFFDSRSTGATGSQVLSAEAAFESIGLPIAAFLVSITAAVANCLFAFWLQPALGWVATASLALAFVAMFAAVVRQRRLLVESSERTATQAGLALEIISSVDKVRSAGAERRLLARWIQATASASASWLTAQRSFVRLASLSAAWFTLTLAASLALVGSAGVHITSADLTAFTAALVSVAAAMGAGLGAVALITALLARLDAAQFVLSHPTEYAGRRLPPAPHLDGGLAVTGVRFRYSGDAPWVLEDVTFTAQPGEFIAIVGPSGSGKSTLFRLLLGFERPASGAITFDSIPIADVDTRSLRRQLGVVLQRGRLVSGSILANLALNRVITEDEAWTALEHAGLADDVRALPMGLHTSVGDGGSALSGGQRQRILIARALVGSPAYLLMDEATSALDNVTQARVAGALSTYDATRIVIAHRLSTVRDADRILVLDRGRIVEEGTFDSLMQAGGLFHALATRQVL